MSSGKDESQLHNLDSIKEVLSERSSGSQKQSQDENSYGSSKQSQREGTEEGSSKSINNDQSRCKHSNS